ncbi:MAG: NAD-binding protein, partial [Balneolaceae bacterium]
KSRGGKPVGIDINPDILKYHLDLGRRVVYADAQDVDMWEQLDMINVKSIIISMSSNIHLKHHLVKIIRKKTWFRGNIYVLTANAREDEVIMESGALPVSIPAVQVGKEMADISMDKSE